MTGWRWNRKLALAVLSTFVVIQLTIPTVLLVSADGSSQRFGWQMFSHAAPDPGFTVVTPTGEQSVALAGILARPRADIVLSELVPPFLCTTVSGAIRVTWNSGSFEC